jgi:hypothetical protein
MATTELDESRRTAALALWRYGHDYLKAAQTLCESHSIECTESQAPFLLAAQGIEFALKSFLRTRGVTPEELNTRIAHSLSDALREALARDLLAPPEGVLHAIQCIAPHHCNDQFLYFTEGQDRFPKLAPLLGAGTWILGQIAATVVADYFALHGDASETSSEDMLRRMRADLHFTTSKVPALQ